MLRSPINNYTSLLFCFPCFTNLPSPHPRTKEPHRAALYLYTESSSTTPDFFFCMHERDMPQDPRIRRHLFFAVVRRRGHRPQLLRQLQDEEPSLGEVCPARSHSTTVHGLLIAESSVSYTVVIPIPYLDNRHG